jgi:hypothetical protein
MANLANFPSLPPVQAVISGNCRICNQSQIISLNRQMAVCETRLKEDPPIEVAVLSQFKAGKRSFVNDLLGKPILPVGLVPATSVINRIPYESQARTTATYLDRRRQETPGAG